MPNRFVTSLVALFALAAVSPVSHADAGQPLTAEPPLIVPGIAARFDYMNVDSENRRLLAAHTGAGALVVVDLKKDAIVESVPVGTIQGVVVDSARDQYITSNSKDQKVVFVSRRTLKPTGEVATSGPCDDLALDPKTSRIYADHDDGTDVWVIDANTRKLVGSVTIPEAPEFVLYDAATDRLYQNIKSDSTVQVINPATNTVESVWKAEPGPHGLALDIKRGRAYSAGNKGKLIVFDIASGKALAEVDIAPNTDQIAIDPDLQRIYCASRGFISVVQATTDGAKLLANVPAAPTAHTIAVDPMTHAVWICYADKEHSYVQKFKAGK